LLRVIFSLTQSFPRGNQFFRFSRDLDKKSFIPARRAQKIPPEKRGGGHPAIQFVKDKFTETVFHQEAWRA
jgi:hypothetical protein